MLLWRKEVIDMISFASKLNTQQHAPAVYNYAWAYSPCVYQSFVKK